MKRIIAIVVIVLFAGFSLTTCKNQDKKSEEEVVKIGAILPLTGNFAWLGKNAKQGIELGVMRAEKEYDINFEVIYGDSKMNPKNGVSLMNKMINVNNVDFFIVNGTTIVNSLIPISKEHQKIMFVQTIHPNITLKSDYTYRLYGGGDAEWKFLAENINQNPSINEIGTFMINAQYGKDSYKSLQKYLKDDVKNLFTIEYSLGEYDFKNVISKNLDKINDVDAIILMGYGNEFSAILKQLKEFNYNKEIYGNIDFTFSFLKNNKVAEGAKFVAPEFSVNKQNEKTMIMMNEFKKAYKDDYVSWDVANSYDNILFLSKIINLNKNSINNPEAFSEEFSKVNTFEGASGKLDVDEKTRTIHIPLVMATLKDSTVVPIDD